MREKLDDCESDRDEYQSEDRRERHASDDYSSEDSPGCSARATGCPKRQATDDKRKRRHDDGTETQACGIQRGFADTLAVFIIHLGKFDDEDCVLCRESNEHNETDRGENVVFKMPCMQCQVRAENRDGSAEQDAEGQGPTFIERGQDQEHEDQGEGEYPGSRRVLQPV